MLVEPESEFTDVLVEPESEFTTELVEPESEFTEVLAELETLDKAESVVVESEVIELVRTGWTSLPIVLICF